MQLGKSYRKKCKLTYHHKLSSFLEFVHHDSSNFQIILLTCHRFLQFSVPLVLCAMKYEWSTHAPVYVLQLVSLDPLENWQRIHLTMYCRCMWSAKNTLVVQFLRGGGGWTMYCRCMWSAKNTLVVQFLRGDWTIYSRCKWCAKNILVAQFLRGGGYLHSYHVSRNHIEIISVETDKTCKNEHTPPPFQHTIINLPWWLEHKTF